MKRLLPLLVVAALILIIDAAVPVARAYPKPSVNPVAWQLVFEHGTPTRITVQSPGQQAPRAYWYMTVKVTNLTGEEQDFLPVFDLVDDKGNVYRSDKDIPKAVFDAVKERERNKFLQPIGTASGRILDGKEQAKDSVAIWPEPLERMGTFQIFVGGLSGEVIWYKDEKVVRKLGRDLVIENLKEKDASKPPERTDWVKFKSQADSWAMMFKTLRLEYQIPGDEFYQGRDVVLLKKEDWVMR